MSGRLMGAVNRYRELSGTFYSFDRLQKATKRYLDWCDRNRVPWLEFMEVRYQIAIEHDAPFPPMHQLAAASLVEHWEAIHDRYVRDQQDRDFQAAELAKAQARQYQEFLAATPNQEAFKRLHLTSSHTCLSMTHWSGGYHPKSAICTTCSLAVECCRRINEVHGFDLVGLRTTHGYVGYIRE